MKISEIEAEARVYAKKYKDDLTIGERYLVTMLAAIDELRVAVHTRDAEIARLHGKIAAGEFEHIVSAAPPGADVMDLAQHAIEATHGWGSDDLTMIQRVARALQQYGDERAREAKTALVLAGWGPPLGAGRAAHEERDAVIARAAIEEAAQDDEAIARAASAYLKSLVDRNIKRGVPPPAEGVKYDDIRAAIRALTAKPGSDNS